MAVGLIDIIFTITLNTSWLSEFIQIPLFKALCEVVNKHDYPHSADGSIGYSVSEWLSQGFKRRLPISPH